MPLESSMSTSLVVAVEDWLAESLVDLTLSTRLARLGLFWEGLEGTVLVSPVRNWWLALLGPSV